MLGILHGINFKIFCTSTLLKPNQQQLIQCACSVTVRCVCVANFAVKSCKYYIICVCLQSQLSNMHRPRAVLYCRLQPVPIYHTFHTHTFMEGTIFRKRSIQKKISVLISSKNFGEAFLVLRRILSDIRINAQTAYCKFTVIIVRFYETLMFATGIHIMQKSSFYSYLIS